jgi:predicted phosphodiesterase
MRQALLQEADSTHIFHLGDFETDLDEQLEMISNKIVFKVPGIYEDSFLHDPKSRIIKVQIGKWDFLLSHLPLLQNESDTDFILYGHTHALDCREVKGITHINPGHLKAANDRGRECSYLTAEVEDNRIGFTWKNLNNETIKFFEYKRRNDDD